MFDPRAWVTIQLARKGQSHATPGSKVGYLLIVERFHRALLQASIRCLMVLVLCDGRSRQRHHQESGNCNLHLVSSFANVRIAL